jgi:hypothetical protein
MNHHPEQLMLRGRTIAMTPEEQAVMRHKLVAYTILNPSRVTRASTAFAWVRRHAIASSVLGALVVLGGTSVSANMAGPNDALYNFKLQVNDRIAQALAPDEDSKMDVELQQIERQLNEEELGAQQALADDSQGDMTPPPTPKELDKEDDAHGTLKAQINGAAKLDGTRSRDDDSVVTPAPKPSRTPPGRGGDDSDTRDIED